MSPEYSTQNLADCKAAPSAGIDGRSAGSEVVLRLSLLYPRTSPQPRIATLTLYWMSVSKVTDLGIESRLGTQSS